MLDRLGRRKLGSRMVVQAPPDSTAETLISRAVEKMRKHDAKFVEGLYTLHYPDGREVLMLPEHTDQTFTLRTYKEELLKDYSKITLFIKHRQNESESEDEVNDEVGFSQHQRSGEDRSYETRASTSMSSHPRKKLILSHGSPCTATVSAGPSATVCAGPSASSDDELPDVLHADGTSDIQPNGATSSSTFIDLGTPTVQFRCTADREKIGSTYETYINLLTDSDTDDKAETSPTLELQCDDAADSDSVVSDLPSILLSLTESLNGDPQLIIVSRRHVLQSFRRSVSMANFSLRRPIKIRFAGEDANDGGGPKREFFRLLMREVDDTILQGPRCQRTFTYSLKHFMDNMYKVAGQAMQCSIAHGGPALPVFNSFVFDMLVDKQPSTAVDYNDIASVPDTDAQCQILTIYSATTEAEFTEAVNASTDWLAEHGISSHSLHICDQTSVVRMLLIHHLFNRFKPAVEQFKCGMPQLLPLVIENPSATKCLFVHSSKPLDFESLNKLYDVQWSESQSNRRAHEEETIYAWEILLHECEHTNDCLLTLSSILTFWTGTDEIPPLGFPERLKVDFYTRQLLQHVDGTSTVERRLPSTTTCSMTLFLPRGVSDPDELKLMLKDAIEMAHGFGKI